MGNNDAVEIIIRLIDEQKINGKEAVILLDAIRNVDNNENKTIINPTLPEILAPTIPISTPEPFPQFPWTTICSNSDVNQDNYKVNYSGDFDLNPYDYVGETTGDKTSCVKKKRPSNEAKIKYVNGVES